MSSEIDLLRMLCHARGWTTTSSVLSAIVATQTARQDLATVGLGPRGPPSDSDAAGATVTPRSPLPGNASIREVLGRLARHSVRPGACAVRAARWQRGASPPIQRKRQLPRTEPLLKCNVQVERADLSDSLGHLSLPPWYLVATSTALLVSVY